MVRRKRIRSRGVNISTVAKARHMAFYADLREVVRTEARLLTFRPVKPDLARLGKLYLGFGLVSAWLAGIGRYWDNPRAEMWQSLGLGSVAYVFVFAAILWLILMPLRPKNWSYFGILTFVGLTSPPGILYAVPVERFLSLSTAQAINVGFLAVVAAWRVALLFLYLWRSAGLVGFRLLVAALSPLVLIVTALTFLNLEHVVFRIMGGLTEGERSGNDAAYGVLILITSASLILALPLLLAYLAMAVQTHRDRRRGRVMETGSGTRDASGGEDLS